MGQVWTPSIVDCRLCTCRATGMYHHLLAQFGLCSLDLGCCFPTPILFGQCYMSLSYSFLRSLEQPQEIKCECIPRHCSRLSGFGLLIMESARHMQDHWDVYQKAESGTGDLCHSWTTGASSMQGLRRIFQQGIVKREIWVLMQVETCCFSKENTQDRWLQNDVPAQKHKATCCKYNVAVQQKKGVRNRFQVQILKAL